MRIGKPGVFGGGTRAGADRQKSESTGPNAEYPVCVQNYAPYIKVAIFVLFIVGSILVRVVRKLMEEKTKREAAERYRRAQEESMRTGGIEPQRGRPIPHAAEPQRSAVPSIQVFTDPADEAKRRLIELARKRREEIEALAREAVGGGPGGQSGPKRASGGGAPPVVSGLGRSAQRPMQQQPVRPPKQQKQPKPLKQRPQPQQAGRDRQPSRQQDPEAPDFYTVAPGGHQHTAAQERESTVHRLVTDAPNAALAAGAASPGALLAMTLRARPDNAAAHHTAVAELRRAIILSEVFSPPVALRGENSDRSF